MPFGIRNKLMGIASDFLDEDGGGGAVGAMAAAAGVAPPPGDPPERPAPARVRRFDVANTMTQQVVPKIAERDPNGVTVVFFNDSVDPQPALTKPEEVDGLFTGKEPGGSCDLHEALTQVLATCTEKRGEGRASSVLCITAGAVSDCDAVKGVIEGAAGELEDAEQLSITFIQIGDDVRASDFLELLDSGLECPHDIVDVCKDDEMNEEIPDPEEPSFMQSGGMGLLVGSLAGAALGAGIYYGVHKYQNRPKEGIDAFIGSYECEHFPDRITQIKVRAGDHVDQVVFVQADGGLDIFGQETGDEQEPFVLEKGEWITEVKGKVSEVHEQVQFVTNTGRESEVYGAGADGEDYSFTAPTDKQCIVGFAGDGDGSCPRPGGVDFDMCPEENDTCKMELEDRDGTLWWKNENGDEWPLVYAEESPLMLGVGEGCPYPACIAGSWADPEKVKPSHKRWKKQKAKHQREKRKKHKKGGKGRHRGKGGKGKGRRGRRGRKGKGRRWGKGKGKGGRGSDSDSDGGAAAAGGDDPTLGPLAETADQIEVERDDDGRVLSVTFGGCQYEREGATINYGYMAAAGVAGALAGAGTGYLVQKKFFNKAAGGDDREYIVLVDQSQTMAVKE